MSTGGNQLFAKLGLATAPLLLCAGLAHAQDDSGGLDATLTASHGLTVSDQDTTSARSNLDFELSSVTRTQTFEFGLSTALDLAFDDGAVFSAQDPSARLAYGVQSRQTALTTALSYRESSVDDLVLDPDGQLGELIFDDGTRQVISADLGLEFGREANFGGTLSLGYDETNYTNTSSPDLIDLVGNSAGLSLRYNFNQRTSATLGYSWSDTDRATGRDVINEGLSLSAQTEMTPTIQADLAISQRRITVTESGVESVTNGTDFNLGVTKTRPNGSLSFTLDSNVLENGRRTTATVGTSFETRRGELAVSLGASEDQSGAIRPLGTLNYNRDLARGSYSIALNQNFSTDSNGDETLNSRLQLAWQHDLNAKSRISTNAAYQISDRLGADDDTTRFQFGFGFSRDLTENWAVTTRYNYSIVDEDTTATQKENELFIGLETAIGWRP